MESLLSFKWSPEENDTISDFNRELTGFVRKFLAFGRVMEAGAGGTWPSLALAREGYDTTLIDNSTSALQSARDTFARVGVAAEFCTGDVFAPGQPTFDLVFTVGCDTDFNKWVPVLRAIATHSRKFILLIVPSKHDRPISDADLVRTFDAAGVHYCEQMLWGSGEVCFASVLGSVAPQHYESADELRAKVHGGLASYRQKFDSQLIGYRNERAWQIMLYIRKAYSLLFKTGWRGRSEFMSWVADIIRGKDPGLAEYDLRFPDVLDFIPENLWQSPARRPFTRPSRYDVIIMCAPESHDEFSRADSTAAQYAGFGHRVFKIVGSTEYQGDCIREVRRNIWEVRLSSDLTSEDIQEALSSIFRDFAIAESCAFIEHPAWRKTGLGLRQRRATKLVYCDVDSWNLPRTELEHEADVVVGNGGTFEDIDQAIRKTFPLVSILIVTYNSADFIERCLESIRRNTTYPCYEVIAIDNASQDGTVDLLRARSAQNERVSVISLAENEGFAAANNRAARQARGEFLIFLNADTIVTPGWIGRLMRSLIREPQAGIVGPVTNWAANEMKICINYSNADEMEEFALDRTRQHDCEVRDVTVAPFFCVMLAKEIWQKLGDLDEAFGIGTFEDDDYCLRARRTGLRVLCVEDCFVHHFGQGSFDQLPRAEYQQLFDKNRRRFEAKWKSKWVPHSLRRSVPAGSGRFSPRQF
jgi:GT2 family glycosyltransferase